MKDSILPGNIFKTKAEISNRIYALLNNPKLRDFLIGLRDKNKFVSVISILNGGLNFGLDLSLALYNIFSIKVQTDYIKINLYKENHYISPDKIFSEDQNIDKYIPLKIKENIIYYINEGCGCIFLVDDICDTGSTLMIAKNYLSKHIDDSIPIEIATVINVKDNSDKLIEPNYYLFRGSESDWYYGYGMDMNGKGLYRNLDFIQKINR